MLVGLFLLLSLCKHGVVLECVFAKRLLLLSTVCSNTIVDEASRHVSCLKNECCQSHWSSYFGCLCVADH